MAFRGNKLGQVPVQLVIFLVLVIVALVLIGAGSEALRGGCPAQALYLFAGAVLLFGIGGTASFSTGLLRITGPPAVVLALVAAVLQVGFGAC